MWSWIRSPFLNLSWRECPASQVHRRGSRSRGFGRCHSRGARRTQHPLRFPVGEESFFRVEVLIISEKFKESLRRGGCILQREGLKMGEGLGEPILRGDDVDPFKAKKWGGGEEVAVVGIDLGKAMLGRTSKVEGVGGAERLIEWGVEIE